MVEQKVLFVDDDQELVKAFQRRFKARFNLDIALSGAEGLESIANNGPYAVVVSDYRMPEMNGVDFLSKVREITPETVRIILTGYGDLKTAIEAVNKGQVFRFLAKPIEPSLLANAVEEGLKYYGLARLERELIGLKKWRKVITEMIDAFVVLVETRDPYTAGHQQRVAWLSGAMAKEMGLPDEDADAVRMAATIHDIGKMYVPAEFLNKPGKLSEIEFDLIKVHPRVGWDILKPIDFEYPISEIIFQHHERLDGSGYPQGLSKDQILEGALIIGVADVVEAMSSHRPYRPSLGLDKALEEVEANKGKLYAPDAVGACLTLFRQKGFVFKP